MIKKGAKVKEINWMGQFARKAVLTVKAVNGNSVLLSDGDQEFWDDISNVSPA